MSKLAVSLVEPVFTVQYRVIYEVEKEIVTVKVIDINAHKY